MSRTSFNVNEKKMVHFVSDTHFGHANIIKYSNRPFENAHEMNKALIDNWNNVVKPQDEVFHLGDFAFSDFNSIKFILSKLNGYKHFIHGNHDKNILRYANELLNDKLFESIQPYKEIYVNDKMIILFHYGARVWNKGHHGSYMLYGHSHGSLPPYGRSVDVGIDAKFITDEYRPVSFLEVQTFMDSRDAVVEDYHGD